MITRFVGIAGALGILIGAIGLAAASDHHGGSDYYDEAANASAVIDAALARAGDEGKSTLLIFGANWCHDSRGLAGHLEADEQLSAFLDEYFIVEHIDVGIRHRNLDQLHRFGVSGVYGTPTLIVLDTEGQAVNGHTAHDWRTADDASTADIMAYLSHHAGFAHAPEAVYSVDFERVIEAWPSYVEAARWHGEALEDGRLTEDDARAFHDYLKGIARSMTRLEMGRHGRNEGLEIIAFDDLQALGLQAEADLTDMIIDRLKSREMDLVARYETQTAETAQAVSDEQGDQ